MQTFSDNLAYWKEILTKIKKTANIWSLKAVERCSLNCYFRELFWMTENKQHKILKTATIWSLKLIEHYFLKIVSSCSTFGNFFELGTENNVDWVLSFINHISWYSVALVIGWSRMNSAQSQIITTTSLPVPFFLTPEANNVTPITIITKLTTTSGTSESLCSPTQTSISHLYNGSVLKFHLHQLLQLC